jgi:hypothetical protein
MPSIAAGEWDGNDLFLRMHFLRKMCCADEKCLSELWWGTGEEAKEKLARLRCVPSRS